MKNVKEFETKIEGKAWSDALDKAFNAKKKDLKVDICSNCHAFWTGNLKQNTTGGRADKFKKKYGIE